MDTADGEWMSKLIQRATSGGCCCDDAIAAAVVVAVTVALSPAVSVPTAVFAQALRRVGSGSGCG